MSLWGWFTQVGLQVRSMHYIWFLCLLSPFYSILLHAFFFFFKIMPLIWLVWKWVLGPVECCTVWMWPAASSGCYLTSTSSYCFSCKIIFTSWVIIRFMFNYFRQECFLGGAMSYLLRLIMWDIMSDNPTFPKACFVLDRQIQWLWPIPSLESLSSWWCPFFPGHAISSCLQRLPWYSQYPPVNIASIHFKVAKMVNHSTPLSSLHLLAGILLSKPNKNQKTSLISYRLRTHFGALVKCVIFIVWLMFTKGSLKKNMV